MRGRHIDGMGPYQAIVVGVIRIRLIIIFNRSGRWRGGHDAAEQQGEGEGGGKDSKHRGWHGFYPRADNEDSIQGHKLRQWASGLAVPRSPRSAGLASRRRGERRVASRRRRVRDVLG